MSRVQCVDCGTAVVIDPSGICPEGHLVTGAGARVTAAVGGGAPHPDEPEPWVATVVLDETDARPAPSQRTIRPVMVANVDEVGDTGGDEADHEAMMRELHALGDLDDLSAAAPAPTGRRDTSGTADTTGAPAPTSSPGLTSVPSPSPAVSRATRDEVAEGFAELSALEAAVHAMGLEDDLESPPRSGGATEAASGARSATSSDELESLEALFGSVEPEPAADRDTPRSTSLPSRPISAAPTSPTAAAPPTGAAPPPTAAPNPTEADGDRSHSPPPTVAPPRLSAVPPLAAEPPAAAAEEPPAEPDAGEVAVEPGRKQETPLDIANFTARGNKVGGGRRKRFGR